MTKKPAETASTSLIIRSLDAVQQRFASMSDRYFPIAAMIVHQSGFAPKPEPSWPDGFEQQGHTILSVKGGPRFDPTVFIEGRPATTSLSRTRECRFYGRNKPGWSDADYSDSIAEYLDAATEAGTLVDQIDQQIKTIIWRDWINGFDKPTYDSLENVPRVVEKHGGSSAQKIPSGKNHFPFIGGTNHAQASVSEAAAV